MSKQMFNALAASILYLTLSWQGIAHEKQPLNRERIQLTIYDNNLAFVRDARSILLKKGKQKVTFKGISRHLIPSTLFIRVLDDLQHIKILEQQFALQAVTYKALLKESIGHSITFYAKDPVTGHAETLQGLLINADGLSNTILVDINGKVCAFKDAQVIFDNMGHHIVPLPSLHGVFEAPQEVAACVELSYITPGIWWSMHYTAEVNEEESSVSFLGLTTVQNNTLIHFNQSKIMLVSTSNTASALLQEPPHHPKPAKPQVSSTPQEKAFAPQELHAKNLRGEGYVISNPVDLPANQTKNIVYIQAEKVSGEKQFWLIFNPSYRKDSAGLIQQFPVTTMISIANTSHNGLGVPLPQGNLLVYQKEKEGFVKVSDQMRINHTPVGSSVPLRLGNAEGIEASVQQTDYKQIGPRMIEVGYRVILKNHKNDHALVHVLQEINPSAQDDLIVSKENYPHRRENGLLWRINVSAHDHQELRYRLRVTLEETAEDKEAENKISDKLRKAGLLK